MLVGSGGVVALVLGAWSVLWAVVGVQDRHWRSYYPVLAAFFALFVAFSMLTAQSEIVLGLVDYVRADRDDRAEVSAYALSLSMRPLFAAFISTCALSIAVALSSRGGVPPILPEIPRMSERILAWSVPVLSIGELCVWGALRYVFSEAVAGSEPLAAAATTLESLALIGALLSFLLIAAASGIAAVRVFARSR